MFGFDNSVSPLALYFCVLGFFNNRKQSQFFPSRCTFASLRLTEENCHLQWGRKSITGFFSAVSHNMALPFRFQLCFERVHAAGCWMLQAGSAKLHEHVLKHKHLHGPRSAPLFKPEHSSQCLSAFLNWRPHLENATS